MSSSTKILFFEDLVRKVEELKRSGKTIVQTHGVFDLIHPGIIRHLDDAKRQGDILIVTIIRDKDVRLGPGRPVFPDELRTLNVSSLSQVDYTCIVDDEIPYQCVRAIKPDIFAKGQETENRDRIFRERFYLKDKHLYLGESQLYETTGTTFCSSSVIESFIDIYPKETRNFIRAFSRRYSFQSICQSLEELKNMKVMVIGDGIIDEYHYCLPMGKAAKSPLVVNKYLTHETFAGGAFAVSNHISGVCDYVTLVTLLGKENSRERFIRESLKPNITPVFFYREDGPTITKKRYVAQHPSNPIQKLFEINYLNDRYINGSNESEVANYLVSELPGFDLVLICDFGHGFITEKLIGILQESSRTLTVNTQNNAANSGFNLVTKYHRPGFVCLDEIEARLALHDKFNPIEEIIPALLRKLGSDSLVVTLGKNGSIGIDKSGTIWRTPVFSSKVIDTVGAGDAFYAYCAPCFAKGFPLDLTTFIGNTVGALAVQTVCNKKSVAKYDLLQFVDSLLKE